MTRVKTADEIEAMREGGKHLASVLHEVVKAVKVGVKAEKLNGLAERLISEYGDESAFLNYTPYGAKRPYPATLCVSVNDEIVHGIPNEKEKILNEGDIVGLDIGLRHKGLFVDMAVTVSVGKTDEKSLKLIEVTKKSLEVAISVCLAGNRVSYIGVAIEKFVKPYGYGIVEELGGHGVGRKVHEEPYVPNFKTKNQGPLMRPGMILALEPMLNEGTKHIKLDKDGHTYRTADGKRSAHFEHTVLITEGEPEILTTLS